MRFGSRTLPKRPNPPPHHRRHHVDPAMDRHCHPLDRHTCGRVHPHLWDLLTAVRVRHTLDVDGFAAAEGYLPACSSVFLVGARPQGSYTVSLPGGWVVGVRNGTLARVWTPSGSPLAVHRLSRGYEQARKRAGP